ncbi:histone acetyltransferase 1, partial [Friedmanniomyces endolithicus]
MATESDDEQTEVLKQQVEDWSTNTNECFTIRLLKGETVTASFQPSFTYPIFGEEERVFGYKDLSITLSFAAHDLQPRLKIKHGKLFSEGDVKPTDIQEALAEFLPTHAFSDASRESGSEDATAASFQPPGEMIKGYTSKGRKYEMWCASLTDAAARQILENMEVLIPMFIEGGTMLQLGQDWSTQRWKLFLLYEVDRKSAPDTSRYSLVGYGTSYRVFTFPDRTSAIEEDQGLGILNGESLEALLHHPIRTHSNPPQKRHLHSTSPAASASPNSSSSHHSKAKDTANTFTILYPNEAFVDLRDLCDLLYLRANVPEFAALRINTDPAILTPEKLMPGALIPTDLIVDGAARERIRRRTKLQARQFDRLVETHTLSFISASHRSRSRLTRKEKSSNADDRAYWFWRLYAKQRLYVHNRDELIQLERAERGVRLEAVLDGVLEGYAGLLERVEKREKGMGVEVEEMEEEVVEGAAKPMQKKRKKVVVDEDEDEDGEEDGMVGVEVVANGHKRPRA